MPRECLLCGGRLEYTEFWARIEAISGVEIGAILRSAVTANAEADTELYYALEVDNREDRMMTLDVTIETNGALSGTIERQTVGDDSADFQHDAEQNFREYFGNSLLEFYVLSVYQHHHLRFLQRHPVGERYRLCCALSVDVHTSI